MALPICEDCNHPGQSVPCNACEKLLSYASAERHDDQYYCPACAKRFYDLKEIARREHEIEFHTRWRELREEFAENKADDLLYAVVTIGEQAIAISERLQALMSGLKSLLDELRSRKSDAYK